MSAPAPDGMDPALMGAALDALDAGVAVESADGVVRMVSQRLLELLGIEGGVDQLVGAPHAALDARCAAASGGPERFLASLASVRQGGVVRAEPLELPDGRTLARDHVPLLHGGARVGTLWVYRDISALVQDAAETEQARRRAERATRAQRDFLAHISHEIRTPLNAVIGMTDLALDGPLDERQRGWLQRARANADALLDLLSDMLDVSKIEARQIVLQPGPFRPDALAREAVAAVRPRAEARGLALEVSCAPETSERRVGDAARIRQIVLNLLTNAVKYTPRGQVVLRVGTAPPNDPTAGADSDLVIEVRDTGIGIAPEDHKRVFDRFWRANQTSSGRMSGTGLGLAITRSLTRLMGGRITLDSAPGRGSCFTVRLPLPLAKEASEPTGGPRMGSRARVLVVDDAPDGRAVTVELLARQGHEAVAAEDGAEAVQLARTLPFDLVVMDVNLPHVDGVEATLQIRAEAELSGRPRVPIVALTAHATEEVRRRCLGAGMDDFATKPVSARVLATLVQRWVPRGAPAEELDPIDLSDLVPMFCRERDVDLARLHAAAEGADRMAVARSIGHRARGSAAALGLAELADLGRALEEAAAAGDGPGVTRAAHAMAEAVASLRR